jgi:hypothetical protein
LAPVYEESQVDIDATMMEASFVEEEVKEVEE